MAKEQQELCDSEFHVLEALAHHSNQCKIIVGQLVSVPKARFRNALGHRERACETAIGNLACNRHSFTAYNSHSRQTMHEFLGGSGLCAVFGRDLPVKAHLAGKARSERARARHMHGTISTVQCVS